MKIYSIFDDFTPDAIQIIEAAGGELTVHPLGVPRPDAEQMRQILEQFNCVILGTSQKITEDMFQNIFEPRLIATASVGVDHIHIPEEKRNLVTVIRTPTANAQSVAEYTMGCALNCCKRLAEGSLLYRQGRDNKCLYQKPEDLAGKTLGVVGAGNISSRIMDYARFFGMEILCWTRKPEQHRILEEMGVHFVPLNELAEKADVISVNLPNNSGTKGLISCELVGSMKDHAIFVSVSRQETVEVAALFEKAKKHPGFYVCLDMDVDKELAASVPPLPNVMVTPHIAGGTVETRKRMFLELANQISECLRAERGGENGFT